MSNPKSSQLTTDHQLVAASLGFQSIFNDDLNRAIETFNAGSSPFHQLGLGVAYFLQAALGMEDNLMTEASKFLANAEAGAKEQAKAARNGTSKYKDSTSRQFPPGMEWDILQADSVVLLGLTNALQESYMGFVKCLYMLNSAHSKFTGLYKDVFPNGLDNYATPAMSRVPSSIDLRSGTLNSLGSTSSSDTDTSTSTASPASVNIKKSSGFFGWGGGVATPRVNIPPSGRIEPNSPSEGLIISGAAFGFGLFNLILSLLPPKARNIISFLGYKSNRALALRALAVSANGTDVHSEFSARATRNRGLFRLALMTYNGFVLLVSGFQADEARIVKQYEAMLRKVENKYPCGSLWVLNRAKLERHARNNENAIKILMKGLDPDRPIHFRQADAMLVFEVAWIFLAERRYEESAKMFLRMQELNHWSHPTYSYLAAGCCFSLKTPEGYKKAREQLDRLPVLLERKKIGGRDLPTEVFIRKKIALYERKQRARGGGATDFFDVIRISPAEELGCVWNNHGNISKEIAEAHIADLMPLTPLSTLPSPYATIKNDSNEQRPDLDLQDEFASRDLLLGILHRGAGRMEESRAFLEATTKRQGVEGQWMINTAYFELAVLTLKVAQQTDHYQESGKEEGDGIDVLSTGEKWKDAIVEAERYLERAAQGTSFIDLGSRLESRIAFLRDEIDSKKRMLGL